jgi:hypothetical protein
MSKTSRLVAILLFLALVLSACNLPGGTEEPPSAGAVLTAAAQTVEANLTQSAVLNTATPQVIAPTSTTAPPTITLAVSPTTGSSASAPTSTQDCDDAEFVTDVTIPDGTVLDPDEDFTKTWRLKNTGTCSWTPSYAVVFSNGDSMSGPATQALTGNVNPGQTMDISVNLKAPGSSGEYTGYWKLRNAAGVMFATFYVDIKVSGGGPFAVTSVNTTVNPSSYSGPCTDPGGYRIDFTFSADITTNAAGTVTYKWERSDNANAPEESITFNSAGTKTVTSTWSRWFDPGDNATGWKRVYINNPNHQGFSQASFTVNCDP